MKVHQSGFKQKKNKKFNMKLSIMVRYTSLLLEIYKLVAWAYQFSTKNTRESPIEYPNTKKWIA